MPKLYKLLSVFFGFFYLKYLFKSIEIMLWYSRILLYMYIGSWKDWGYQSIAHVCRSVCPSISLSDWTHWRTLGSTVFTLGREVGL